MGKETMILASDPYLIRFVQEGSMISLSPSLLRSSMLFLCFCSCRSRVSRLNQALDSTFARVIMPMTTGNADNGSGCARDEIDRKDSESRGVGSVDSCMKREDRVMKTG